ncbi:MAG: thiolase family protein [Dehalococcoidales bacterium]|nr:thiolase family protein [Dehalococcoidales bacterium]
MEKAVIVGALRTAIGRYGGTLADVKTCEMQGVLLKEMAKRYEIDPSSIEDVFMGSCLQSGEFPNLGRQAVFRAGFPLEVTGTTVDRQCISGFEAAVMGKRAIECGDMETVFAGGAENLSGLVYYITGARWGYKLGNAKLLDQWTQGSTTVSGPEEMFGYAPMPVTAENVAEKYGLTRQELDEYAVESHRKAVAAQDAGKFKAEIVPMEVKQKKQTIIFDTDEHPRRETTVESLGKLPCITPKKGGIITAGNSCGMNDGAALIALMSESKAKKMGKKIRASLVTYCVAGVDPRYMGIGPVPAAAKALKKAGLTWDDIDLIELNEAFASQAIACIRDWKKQGLKRTDHINVNGSGIALGHPVGCTGVRLIVTLLHEMERRDLKRGMATACAGGGMGGAFIIERP